ncbi:MAG: alkaline phosphatase family protein [Deltaproteobacteria bacterium]|nr:alkaline phosphatase family protein [Deltaproteobacteria bacterium]
MKRRLLVIGLDCAEPSLVFGALRERMPCTRGLCDRGTWGELRSTDPPITMPAWLAMFTGLDPGELGVYGFRNRPDHGYGPMQIASARSTRASRVWDRLSEAGLCSFLLGVPGTYPPWPIRGRMVASFLSPGKEAVYTYPRELAASLDALAGGEYLVDVTGFRTEDKDWLLGEIRRMTTARFQLARTWAAEPDWDLFALVEMGPDRLHHGFWRHFDPAHRLHQPSSPYTSAIPDYYALLDSEIASLVEAAGPGTAVMLVSDHGARAMQGGFCINEWLVEQGDLVLASRPEPAERLQPEHVDWTRTRAWGAGGYYGRVFINVQGREPSGAVPRAQLEGYRADLIRRLEATADEDGRSLGTRVLRPDTIYRRVSGIPPDLLVYFGDLAWRSIGTLGSGRIHVRGNDTGPDDANHDRHGIFVFADPARPGDGARVERDILEVTPAILDFFGLA